MVIINTDQSLYGDMDCWLVIIFIIATLIAVGMLIVKKLKNREKLKLGRRAKATKKAAAKQAPDYCYKNCTMIAKYQECLLETEGDNVALWEKTKRLQKRLDEKNAEITELRTQLYALQSKK